MASNVVSDTRRKDLSMFRGDHEAFELAVTVDAAPYDISTSTIWFTAKRAYNDTDSQAYMAKDNAGVGGIAVTDGPGGICVLTIESADTEDLTADTDLYYDVQIELSAGEVHTIVYGLLKIRRDVTIRKS
jgi:hypothetical protein